MVDINFINSNPALDAFNRANKAADDEATSQLNQQRLKTDVAQGQYNLQQAQAEGPTRLRQLQANADLAQTQAQYAPKQAQASLEATRQQTLASISQMNNATAQRHMDAFTKEMQLLDAGDVQGAKALAASIGDTIPDAVIQSSQARATIKSITAMAQQNFQGRPKEQMAWIAAQIAHMGEQQQQGQTPNPQTAPYQQVPGAPAIPESTEKPVNVPAGGTLVDPSTGKPLYQSSATKWGIIGYDEYGNPIHGYPPAPGAPQAPPGSVQQRPVSQSAVMPPPGNVPPVRTASNDPNNPMGGPLAGDTGNPNLGYGTVPPQQLHGQAYLDYLKKSGDPDADLVQAIGENRISPNSLSVKGGHRERVLQKVTRAFGGDYNQTLYSGAQSYQRTTGAAAGRVEMATNEVAKALPLALQSSRNLPRTAFVPWNKLMQAYQSGTSDPAYYDFITKNMALVNAYVRAMNPQGVPRVAERLELHANNMLNAATSAEAYEVQAKALWQEVQQSRAAVAEARGGVGPSANEATTAPMPGLPGGGGGVAPPAIPSGAINMLRQNPALRDQFDAKYGAGASDQYLSPDGAPADSPQVPISQ